MIIEEMFPVSAKIGLIALVIAIAVGIPIGCLSAYYRGTKIDSGLRVFMTLGISVPSFVYSNTTIAYILCKISVVTINRT